MAHNQPIVTRISLKPYLLPGSPPDESSPNKPFSDLDFLSFLPLEIWRYILFYVASFTNVPHPCTEALGFLNQDVLSYESSQAAQRDRLSLLTVSRHLYPLALQFLYTEVVVRGIPRLGRAIQQGTKGRANGWCPGDWTTSVLVYTPHRQSMQFSLESLLSAFPNVIYVMTDAKDVLRSDPLSPHESGLKGLFWKNFPRSFDCSSLQDIALHFRNLQWLKVTSPRPPHDHDQPVIFGSLKSLSIGRNALSEDIIARLHLPALQRLSIEMGGQVQLYNKLLHLHGAHIIALELTAYLLPESFPDKIFEFCPDLQTLSLHVGMIRSPSKLSIDLMRPHRQLTNLLLTLPSPDRHNLLAEYACLFIPSLFPNLLRASLALDLQSTSTDRKRCRDYILRHFPHLHWTFAF